MPGAGADGVQSGRMEETGHITIQYVADQSYLCKIFIFCILDQLKHLELTLRVRLRIL